MNTIRRFNLTVTTCSGRANSLHDIDLAELRENVHCQVHEDYYGAFCQTCYNYEQMLVECAVNGGYEWTERNITFDGGECCVCGKGACFDVVHVQMFKVEA